MSENTFLQKKKSKFHYQAQKKTVVVTIVDYFWIIMGYFGY